MVQETQEIEQRNIKRKEQLFAASIKRRKFVAKIFQNLKGKLCSFILISVFLVALVMHEVSAQQEPSTSEESPPANHRMEEDPKAAEAHFGSPQLVNGTQPSSRHGRQYDTLGSPSMSVSSTGNYGSLASSAADSAAAALAGAYLGSSPAASSAAASAAGGYGVAASGDIGSYSMPSASVGNYHGDLAHYARSNYPSNQMHVYGPHAHMPSTSAGPPFASMFPMSSLGGGGAGLFSPSSAFPLMAAKGFDLTEVVCTALAVAIGAVIVGAPFILLYLFIMNQVQGGQGPGGLGGPASGGAISLTGPTASTNVSGRKKRQTAFPDALFKQLSPLINNEQVLQSFKLLLSSMAKYQV